MRFLHIVWIGFLLHGCIVNATEDETFKVEIITKNLQIRPFGMENADIDRYAEIYKNPELMQCTFIGKPMEENTNVRDRVQERNFSDKVRPTPLKAYMVCDKKNQLLGIASYHTDLYPLIEGDWRTGWALNSTKDLQEETFKAMMEFAFNYLPQRNFSIESLSLGFRTEDSETLNLLHKLDPNLRPNANFEGGGLSPNGDYFKLRSLWYHKERNVTWQTYFITKKAYSAWEQKNSSTVIEKVNW